MMQSRICENAWLFELVWPWALDAPHTTPRHPPAERPEGDTHHATPTDGEGAAAGGDGEMDRYRLYSIVYRL